MHWIKLEFRKVSFRIFLDTGIYFRVILAADVWSVGVMIIELLENNCPFDPDSEIRALHMIFEALGTPSADVWLDYPKMRYYCEAFPKWTRKPWKDIAPHAPSVAWNLIEVCIDQISCHVIYEGRWEIRARSVNLETTWYKLSTVQTPFVWTFLLLHTFVICHSNLSIILNKYDKTLAIFKDISGFIPIAVC